MPLIKNGTQPTGNLEGEGHGATISGILDESEPGRLRRGATPAPPAISMCTISPVISSLLSITPLGPAGAKNSAVSSAVRARICGASATELWRS
jgi:hypothetical protein